MNIRAELASAAEPRVDGQPLRLLVAERDENATEALLGCLRNAALTLRAQHVDDLRELHTALANRAWDLLVAHRDAALGTVREIVAAVREHDSALPVLLLDSAAAPQDVTPALRDGVADVVPADDRERLLLVVQREWGHARDRNRLRYARAAHAEIAHRIDLLLATTEAGVAYVLDGMHVFANGEYLRLFGYADVDDLLGATMLDLVDTDDHDVLKTYLRGVGNAAREPLRLRCRSRDGTSFAAALTIEPAAYEGEACWQVNLRPAAYSPQGTSDVDAMPVEESALELALNELETIHADVIATGGTACLAAVQWRDRASQRGALGLGPTLAVDARIGDMLREAFATPHRVLSLADDVSLVLLRDQPAEVARIEVADLAEHIAGKIASESNGALRIALTSAVAPLGDELSHDFAAVDELLRLIERSGATTNGGATTTTTTHSGETTADSTTNGGAVGQHLPPPPHPPPVDSPDKTSTITSVEEPIVTTTDFVRLRADVERCLLANSFHLMFQPIISVRGEPDELYEALLFAPSSEPSDEQRPISLLGLPPDALPAATCSRVDRWLVLQSIRLLSAHRATGHDTRLMLNLSAASLEDTSFPQWLGVAIRAARLPADALVFQVSERDVLRDVGRSAAFLQALATLHFRTALCEFLGAGDPRSFIARLSVDFVKLDGSLLANVQRDAERRMQLVRTIDALQSRGKLTIVPMIDSAAMLAVLYQAGANYIQGDYLQEPSPDMDYNFAGDE